MLIVILAGRRPGNTSDFSTFEREAWFPRSREGGWTRDLSKTNQSIALQFGGGFRNMLNAC